MRGPRWCSFVFLLIVSHFRESFCDFSSDYLGNFISDEEYNNRTFCWTPVCMYDAGRLIYDADHDSQASKPCENFPKFAMGEFLKHRVLNDRYAIIGFNNDVFLQYYEKRKRILRKKSNVDDPKIFKVIKSFFKKCADTGKIEKNGQWEMFDYINKLGGSLLTSGASWNESQFDLKNWFSENPAAVFQVVFHYLLPRCPNGQEEKLCLKPGSTFYHDEIIEHDVNYVLNHLKHIDKSLKKEAADDFFEFLSRKSEFVNAKVSTKNVTSKEFKTVNDLIERFPAVDWLKGFNRMYFKRSKVSSNTKVSVKTPEYLEATYECAVTFNKTKMANVLATSFLYSHSNAFIPYGFNQEEMTYQGAKRSLQRFEECIETLEQSAPEALKALEAQHLFDPEIRNSAVGFAKEAIKDYRHEVTMRVQNETLRTEIVKKLNAIKIIAMFPDDVLNISKVEKLYEELELNGTESYVEMLVELSLHNFKLRNEPDDSWIKDLYNILAISPELYDKGLNTFYIPGFRTVHPWFHPKRSRFFNMVTMYFMISELLYDNFEGKALTKVHNLPEARELAYLSYKRWIEKGGEDLLLSGFKMTNLQMFWLCYAHVATAKLHHNYPEEGNQELKLVNKYMHVYLKSSPLFREAFKCDAMTEDEMKQYEEFRRLSDSNNLEEEEQNHR